MSFFKALLHGKSIGGIWEQVKTVNGLIQVVPVGLNSTALINVVADATVPNATGVLSTNNFNSLFNGVNFDRQRANTTETVLASAQRNATTTSADFTNYNARGLHAIIDVTGFIGVPTITPKLQGKDAVSGKYYDILVGTPIASAIGTVVLKLYPGITPLINAAASDILPRTWRVVVTHADAQLITYSVGATLIL